MKKLIQDYEIFAELFYNEKYNEVIKLWESTNYRIDFNETDACYTFDAIMDSYRKLGQSEKWLELIKYEIKTCKKEKVIPNNLIVMVLSLSNFYFKKNKDFKAYRVLLLFDEFKTEWPPETEGIHKNVELPYYKKHFNLIVGWIYPIAFLTLIGIDRYLYTFFENQRIINAFTLINVFIFLLLIIGEYRKKLLFIKSYRRIVRILFHW